MIVLHPNDCLDALAGLPECSVDAAVCDPPYGLGFMGKHWDAAANVAFRPETWAAVLRVLKPGGHLVAFSGTRTYHRMVVAIEDAGFEVRDQLAWVFGSGFPKSHDVSKAIDKAGGISPRVQAGLLREKRVAAGMSRDELAAIVGCTPSSIRDWEEGRSRSAGAAIEWIVPSDDYRSRLVETLGYTSDERRVVGVSIDRRGDGTVYGVGHSGELRAGGNTDAAREWQGWGTALKPSFEPICLARKPLSEGTVAANVLRWGTGALNIDATRIGTSEDLNGGRYSDNKIGADGATYGSGINKRSANDYSQPTGRWPANLCHDGSEEVLAGFPQSKANVQQSAERGRRPGGFGNVGHEKGDGVPNGPQYGDEGSAARFFYCAKANKTDRVGSKHPTVKPVALMRWLVRMVTPSGGTVLDPFAGTGTTGQAALEEGFKAILIEREAEYVADIKRRLRIS